MAAVWMRLMAEVRARRRAWLGLAALVSVFGGAVVASAIGAARTGSVVDRYVEQKRPANIFLMPAFGIQESTREILEALSFKNLRTLPSVEDGTLLLQLPAVEELEILAPADARAGREIFPQNILEGRLPDPERADEATVDILASRKLGLHAGDTYTIHFLTSFPYPPGAEPRPGPTVNFRITGVSADIGNFAAIAEPGLFLTPAFLDRYGAGLQTFELSLLRLRNAAASYPQFRGEVAELTGGATVFYVESGNWEEARSSFGLQATSLWILTAILAFVTILVLGQTIARQTFLDSSELPILRSLGISRRDLFTLGILRAAAFGIVGAAGAVVVAVAASPLAPFGDARLADPDPAFSAPAQLMLLGFAGVGVGVVALALVPAWRAARAAAAGIGPAERPNAQPAKFAEAVSRLVRGPAAGIGVRMALEPGIGRTAVPVRTTISASAVALLALTAALVVGASLDRLSTTPRLYGWDWDVAAVSPAFNDEPSDPEAGPSARAALRALPGIAAASFGPEGGTILVDGRPVEPYGLELDAAVHPPILEGRAPRTTGELLVARKTLRDLGRRIGDEVPVGFQGSDIEAPFRVVGVTVLPVASDVSTLGEGIWLPVEALGELFGEQIPMDRALIRFDSRADRDALLTQIAERFEAEIKKPTSPGTVVDFGRVSNMPYLLAGIVALLAAGTLGHGLVTAIRRRRRDIAVLKSLGLDRGQARRAVAWQASAVVVLTLAIGIPLGVIAGRWTWMLFADRAGFLAEPVADLSTLAACVPIAAVLANAIAALPARSAARTQPALVLRTE